MPTSTQTVHRADLIPSPMTLATGGLFFSWLAHDVEELATMESCLRNGPPVPPWVPLPDTLRRPMSQNHINVAVAVMGAFVAAAAIDGWRSKGEGWYYQNALEAYGLHGFVHIAASVVAGGYTSGVATCPVAVLPYWIWATRQLRAAGVRDRRNRSAALALTAAALGFSHLVAHVVTRRWQPAAPKP